MNRIHSLTNTYADITLEHLLQQRRAPLSHEGMQTVLQNLTVHMTKDIIFYMAAYPEKNALAKQEIHASDIDRIDMMYATDEERYLPIFSTLQKLQEFKPNLHQEERIYTATKQDLLDFLNINGKVAAAVVNPGTDDLLLYRMQLQNMIQIGKEQN